LEFDISFPKMVESYEVMSISKTASDRNLTKESNSEGEMKVLGNRALSLPWPTAMPIN